MAVQTIIKHRRDTAANWTSTNPTLAAGELGLETDTGLVKYGDGSTAWTALAYPSSTAVRQYVKNSSGSAMTKGQAVYISSSNGTNPLISLSQANAESTSSKTLGLLVQDLANNGFGYVITDGLLGGLNTSSATAGDPVWLSSSTAGSLVYGLANKPHYPAHMVYIGVVTRAHATQGEILVKVQNGFELEELHNVDINTPAYGDVLMYDDEGSRWLNQPKSALGFANASHTHTFADITSVNITSPTNGQSLTYDSASSKWINSAAAATGETISSFLLMGA